MGDLKNREKVGTTLLKWHAASIRQLSACTKRSISSFMDEAIDDLLKKRKYRKFIDNIKKEPTDLE